MDEETRKKLQEQEARWAKFVNDFGEKYPELKRVSSQEQLISVANKYGLTLTIKYPEQVHISTQPPPESRAPSAHESGAESVGSNIFNTIGLPLAVMFRPPPKIIEDDKKYKKIVKNLIKDIEEEKGKKYFETKEGIDQLYGSLDDPTAPTIHDKAKELFREQEPKLTEKYDKANEKPHKESGDDPYVQRTETRIKEENWYRQRELKQSIKKSKEKPSKKALKKQQNELEQKVTEKHWLQFAATHTEKAKAYSEKNEAIKKGYETHVASLQPQPFIEPTVADVLPTPQPRGLPNREERQAYIHERQAGYDQMRANTSASSAQDTSASSAQDTSASSVEATSVDSIPAASTESAQRTSQSSVQSTSTNVAQHTEINPVRTPPIVNSQPNQPLSRPQHPTPTELPHITPVPPMRPQPTPVQNAPQQPRIQPTSPVSQPGKLPTKEERQAYIQERQQVYNDLNSAQPITQTPTGQPKRRQVENQQPVARPNHPPPQQNEERKKSSRPDINQIRKMFRQNEMPQRVFQPQKFTPRITQFLNRGLSNSIGRVNNFSSLLRTGANFGRLGSLFGGGGAAAGGVGAGGAAGAGAVGGAGAAGAAATGAAAAGGAAAGGAAAGAGGAAAGGGAVVVAASPVGWVIGAVLIILLLIIIVVVILLFIFAKIEEESKNKTDTGTSTKIPIPGLKINLTGPDAVKNNDNISYSIRVTYSGTSEVTIYDPLPSNATFISASDKYTHEGSQISWKLAENDTSVPSSTAGIKEYSFSIVLHPTTDDSIVKNKVTAKSQSVLTGSIKDILNGQSGQLSSKASALASQITSILTQNPNNIEVYKEAEKVTGVPWQVLAGIHYVEGGMGPNKSLVSGRDIGTNEPDIVRGGGCSSSSSQLGAPKPVPGGCGFSTLLESAIYAGNHLKQKAGGSLSTLEEAAKALSMYNGGGNRNCFQLLDPFDPRTPWNGCPRQFIGEDDPYVFNNFDTRHENMYLVWCADLERCTPPKPFGDRLGSMTVARVVAESF